MRVSKEQKASMFAWLQRLIGAGVVVTAIPAVISVLVMGVIPDKYFYVIAPIYAAIAGLVVWRLARGSKKLWQGALWVLAGMLLVLVNIHAY